MTTEEKTAEKENLNRIYEVGFLLVPQLGEENVGAEVTKIKDAIEKAEGLVISEGFPTLNTLTYTMEKRVEAKIERYSEGYFGWIKFEAPSSSVEEFDATLKANMNIIRHMIISTVRENTLYEKPKRVVRPKADDDQKDAPEMSEEELDQSIDELVIE